MRGTDERSGSLFSYVDLEARIPKGHPLRTIREIVNGALSKLNGDFAAMYAPLGRPSIAPEKLLRYLSARATAQGTTVSTLVNGLLKKYIELIEVAK